MKLEPLRVFVMVAEAGNIKDAADRMGRTASAISMTLKQLEQDIGGPLFETDRKDTLSALGVFVLETGQVQVQSFDQAVSRIRAFADNRIGRLALASVPSVAANMVPTLLPEFVAERPGVEIELFDLDSRNVRLFVESGQADIGISGQPRSQGQVIFQPLFRDRFKLVCSAASPLADAPLPLSWSEIEGHTLIANGASEKINSPDYHKIARHALFSVPNVTSLLALTKSGLGVTLLPALSTIDLPVGVVALPLEDDDVERTVGLLTRRRTQPNPVTAAFRDYVIDRMPELTADLGLDLTLGSVRLGPSNSV